MVLSPSAVRSESGQLSRELTPGRNPLPSTPPFLRLLGHVPHSVLSSAAPPLATSVDVHQPARLVPGALPLWLSVCGAVGGREFAHSVHGSVRARRGQPADKRVQKRVGKEERDLPQKTTGTKKVVQGPHLGQYDRLKRRDRWRRGNRRAHPFLSFRSPRLTVLSRPLSLHARPDHHCCSHTRSVNRRPACPSSLASLSALSTSHRPPLPASQPASRARQRRLG